MAEEPVKVGAYLRALRLEENDSLEEIAAGITTAATLSRFERGETQLSAAVVLKLLTRFDQDVELMQQGYRALNPENFFQQVNRATVAGKSALQVLAQKQYRLWRQTGLIFYRLNQINILAHNGYTDPSFQTTPQMKADVIKYLKRIRYWGLYELDLFAATLVIYDHEQLMSLVMELVLDWPDVKGHPTRNQYLWAILTNSIALLIHRREFTDAVRLLNVAKNLPIPADDLYARIMLRYQEHLLTYHRGQHRAAKMAVKNLLATLALLDSPFFAQLLTKSWRRFLKEEAQAK
ncbi:helix-turn-helix domain-containing protein [Lacticaseibacillus casei]|jgi:Rgg/GadR/MutR family transcriptional activator|uniref:Helix-turn-helix domain-containing protein n=1 Tax=Lacticaseibacillus huelsenbergensis TaxID=3035291 RepID=A0ABY8DT74_9LACO|nr:MULTISPECIES: Rgg/GadR/MutR family transcriptional regulator [Lacticaseibacillus]MDG3062432.1 helix-turn-helix domain-containing protein [Lacticaseibacillus sp. BCRC 81376]MDN4553491.1 helix-turn-helix domain-containing protein [Lacticaseibacillus paracasei]QVI36530.1 helix-turn-helix domain-containing protein [Lacticaseibacillus casei]QXG58324.1 helix-turn-helix domain-containing protein [Lacticaseibacillus casei]WFB40216.1 helix-turn-helix domain-containing protein [Lacticaseibacillus hue